jgi:hypothetical protein
MTAGVYPFILWRDRPYPLNRVMGPKELERGATAMDPDAPQSMNDAIVAASARHGWRRDLTLYQLDVYHPRTGALLCEYRYTAWLAGDPLSLDYGAA